MKLEEFMQNLIRFGFSVKNLGIPYAKSDSRCWSLNVSRGDDVCIVTYFQNRGELGRGEFDILYTRPILHIPVLDIYETLETTLKK